MSLRHSILGLLAIRPLTGYEIKKIFDETLAHAWNAYDSQIYPELHRLEEQGLISVEALTDGRRQRRVNELTEAGRTELQRWFEEGGPSNRLTRDEFLLRVFFFGLMHRTEQRAWLAQERERLEAELAAADDILAREAIAQPKSARGRDLLRWQMACIDLHVAQTTARLEWIRSAEKEIG